MKDENDKKQGTQIDGDLKKQNSMMKEAGLWVRDLGICLIIALLFINFVAQNTYVDGPSMNPTLHDGEYVIINKFIYYFTSPDQGDIVVFPSEGGKGDPFIKRVIGVPGDEIDIKDGFVYRNGEKVEESYVSGPVEKKGDTVFPVKLSEGDYFVLGDNRAVSFDSRYLQVGNIKKKDIIGRAGLRIWPPSRIGLVK